MMGEKVSQSGREGIHTCWSLSSTTVVSKSKVDIPSARSVLMPCFWQYCETANKIASACRAGEEGSQYSVALTRQGTFWTMGAEVSITGSSVEADMIDRSRHDMRC